MSAADPETGLLAAMTRMRAAGCGWAAERRKESAARGSAVAAEGWRAQPPQPESAATAHPRKSLLIGRITQ